jgi:hypothetical protein
MSYFKLSNTIMGIYEVDYEILGIKLFCEEDNNFESWEVDTKDWKLDEFITNLQVFLYEHNYDNDRFFLQMKRNCISTLDGVENTNTFECWVPTTIDDIKYTNAKRKQELKNNL